MSWQRWDRAWQEALYGPAGFYRHQAPADHFATSAQGLGTAGSLLAEALATLAARNGLTRIVEVAAGRGELLTALADTAPDLDLLAVEVSERPRGLPEQIGWLHSAGEASLPAELTGLRHTLLLAHEWFDVLPCPVVTRHSQQHPWHHIEVARDGAERLGEPVTGPELAWLQRHLPDEAGEPAAAPGQDSQPAILRAEVGLPRDQAYADLLARVDQGLVVVVDYGHTAEHRPPEGSLTGYRDGAQVAPVPDGSCDLTAHVAVDTLGADTLATQREMVHDLLGPATLPPHALSQTQPTAYLAELTRANALATLTNPTGLGGFWWAMSHREADDLG